MRKLDDHIEAIVRRALHLAGVRDIDGDAGMLRQIAVAQYLQIAMQEPEARHEDLLDELSQAVIPRRYRDWSQDECLKMKTPVQHNKQEDLLEASLESHLNHNERHVLYLLLVVGMTEEEVVDKFGAGSDWVETTIAKVHQLRQVDSKSNHDV